MGAESVSFDVDALMRMAEGNIARKMLRASNADEAAQKAVCKVLAVFEKHGIGAMQAIQIMTDISKAFDKQ